MGAHAPIFAAPWTPIYEGPLLSNPIKFPARKIRNTCLRFPCHRPWYKICRRNSTPDRPPSHSSGTEEAKTIKQN